MTNPNYPNNSNHNSNKTFLINYNLTQYLKNQKQWKTHNNLAF